MFNNLKHDWQRYTASEGKGLKSIFYLVFTQGLWAIIVYRFGSWSNKVKVPVLGHILRIIYFFLFKGIEILTGISIDCNAQIGPGLYIGHFGQIFIYSETVIGEQAAIGQGVTIGTLGLGKKGAPSIGNNVFIGTGAKILGPIRLGNNVHVGANAVVLKDVPDRCTVVGIPGKIIQRKDEGQ